MASCWKGDESNLPKNQYKTKLFSHQTSSVLNEYIKYHTVFCILDLYTVYRGVLPPNLSSYALTYEIYIIHIYIYIYIPYILYMYIYIYIYIYIYPQTRVSLFPGLISVARVNEYMYIYIYIYIYSCYDENNVPTRLSPRWLYGNSCTRMRCHKAIVVITERGHCFHDKIYIIVILLLWDLSTLCVVDHLWPLIYITYILYHLYILKYNCIFRKEMSFRQFYILWHWIQTLVFTLSK